MIRERIEYLINKFLIANLGIDSTKGGKPFIDNNHKYIVIINIEVLYLFYISSIFLLFIYYSYGV